jgi:hypothetical protein
VKQLLILTSAQDATTDYLIPALERHDIPFVRWDSGSVPTQALCSLRWSGDMSGQIIGDFGDIDLSDVGCIYYRRPTHTHAPESAPIAIRQFINGENSHLISGMLRTINSPIVCDPKFASHADIKPLQHKIASDCGLSVPETLYSNNPSDIRKFIQSASGPVVMKTINTPGARNSAGEQVGILTSEVSLSDLDIRAVAQSVSIYQHRVDKAYELRVTVIGDEVHAVGIDASASILGRQDWRAYDLDRTKHWVHDLPVGIAEKCRAVVDSYDLHYGAIDLIVTPDGEHVFLEINAFGQWAWLEELTGVPLSDAHCRLFRSLMKAAEQRPFEAGLKYS